MVGMNKVLLFNGIVYKVLLFNGIVLGLVIFVLFLMKKYNLGPRKTIDRTEDGFKIHVDRSSGWTEVTDKEKYDRYLKRIYDDILRK